MGHASSFSVVPSNGCVSVVSSYKMMPRLQTSLLVLYGLFSQI